MLVLAVAACGKSGGDPTTESTVKTNDSEQTTVPSKTDPSTGTTAPVKTDPSTGTTAQIVEPIGKNDPVTEKAGSYANVIYNPAYCTVTYEVKKNVGSREDVTVKIKMRDGYIFDGWSVDDAIANGAKAESKSSEFTISLQNSTTIWANYSVKINYDPNGGKVVSGGSKYTQKFSVTWYKCPNTLPERGYFVRDGYTLLEYNTKADGSGESISLGSRVPMYDKPETTLYCIWAKQSDVSDFVFSLPSGGEVCINEYKGKDETVVIPDTYNGNKVTTIGDAAFIGGNVKTVVLSKNITTVADNAFYNCQKLDTIYIYDSISYISDKSFGGETSIKNLRVNAVYELYNFWTINQSNVKMDRLIYAKSMGKKVIVIYGGSGALNGFDCASIDEAFGGEYYVINLGCNANVTAALYFEYLQNVLEKDDIILWAPEAGGYMYGSTYFSNRAWEFNGGHYDIFRGVNVSNYAGVFSYFPNYSVSHSMQQKPFDSFSKDINCYGDNMSVRVPLLKDYNYSRGYSSIIGSLSRNAFGCMNNLIKALSDKGVKVYFTYPAMDEEGGGLEDELMSQVEEAIKKAFPDVTIISKWKDCLVKHDQMFDSEWHITLEGAAARTKIVIRDLKAQIAKEGK